MGLNPPPDGKVIMQFTIDPEVKELLRRKAESQDRSLSWLARLVLGSYVQGVSPLLEDDQTSVPQDHPADDDSLMKSA
jgi:hypothetical protein